MQAHSDDRASGDAPSIVFRDDDVNRFTDCRLLERTFGQLWNVGKRVLLSITPLVTTPNRLPHLQDALDPNVPLPFASEPGVHPIQNHRSLVRLIRDLVRNDLVELAVHGLTHEYGEFHDHDLMSVMDRIRGAREIIEDTFSCSVSTFVPPYEEVTTELIQALSAERMILFTQSGGLPIERPPDGSNRPFSHSQCIGNLHVMTADMYLFGIDQNLDLEQAQVESVLARQFGDYVVSVTHSWAFASNSLSRWGLWDYLLRSVINQKWSVMTPASISERDECDRFQL